MTGYITIMYKFILIFRMCVYFKFDRFLNLAQFFSAPSLPWQQEGGRCYPGTSTHRSTLPWLVEPVITHNHTEPIHNMILSMHIQLLLPIKEAHV